MRRQAARSLFILLCGALATVFGVLGAVLYTGPGLRLLTRILSDQAPALVRGSVQIGAVHGNWINGFALDSVVIRDTAGVLLFSAPRVEVRYVLTNLIA